MSSLKARLLKASAKLLGTAARDVPVPYELRCECGQRVTGIRRATGIQAVCSACQTTLYVLPVNVYPSTRRVRSEVLDGSLASRVGAVMKDIVVGETNPEHSDPPRAERRSGNTEDQDSETEGSSENGDGTDVRPRRRSNRGRATAKSNRPESGDRRAAAPETDVLIQVPKVSLGTRLQRVFSPMRLLALAGVAVLMGTGWWVIQQQRVEAARRIWRLEMDVAESTLKGEDLAGLRTALTKAVGAAAILGRMDPETRRAKSLLEQTVAVEEQSSLDLVAQLAGVFSEDGELLASKARDVCAGLPGQRLIFECSLKRLSETVPLMAVDMPLIVGSVPVRIRVQSARLDRLTQATPNASVLFSAAILRCEPPEGADGEWRITLAGRSCALFTTELHVSKLGYDPDSTPGLIPLLKRQAQFVESDNSDESEESEQQPDTAGEEEPKS